MLKVPCLHFPPASSIAWEEGCTLDRLPGFGYSKRNQKSGPDISLQPRNEIVKKTGTQEPCLNTAKENSKEVKIDKNIIEYSSFSLTVLFNIIYSLALYCDCMFKFVLRLVLPVAFPLLLFFRPNVPFS